MAQKEINMSEWENPENWGGPKWLSVYFSKKDTRWWVPKQIPWMGLWCPKATPNLAHIGGLVSFLLIMLALLCLAFVMGRITVG